MRPTCSLFCPLVRDCPDCEHQGGRGEDELPLEGL